MTPPLRLTSTLDVCIAAAIAVWAIVETLLLPNQSAAQLVFALVISIPLAVRRSFPALVMSFIAAALVVHAAAAGSPDATFNPFPSLLVMTFTVGERIAAWWRAVLLGVVPIAAMLIADRLGYFGTPGMEATGALFLVFFVAAVWGFGRIVRARALALQRVSESAEERAHEAAALERRRIARELHDIIAHSLSIVALQAAAAEQFVERDPARARTHLSATRRTAQGALDEMRHLLDLLNEDGASYAPQPGLESIQELISDTEAAGHRVDAQIEVSATQVPESIALAAFRIVQEALTNVRKHAPGAAVRVTVSQQPAQLLVAVHNAASAPRKTARAPLSISGGGHGIPGMRERVRLYGGAFKAGATPDKGWLVQASLPLEGAR